MMIAIVGAGVAGLSAALELRELGFAGDVRVFSAEAAEPYDRPSLSKGFLSKGAPASPPELCPREMLARKGVDVVLDTAVVCLDPSAQKLYTEAGEAIAYERALLATGAIPRRLDLPGSELKGVHYLRDVEQARRLRSALHGASDVVVVGGGVLGLEVAAQAVAVGVRATVLEAETQLMRRVVPASFAKLLLELHEARGVRVITGARPVAFEASSGCVRAVVTADGLSIPADVVVVSIGADPCTETAERSGILVEDGILVDDRLRSSDECVLAAGDVARIQLAATGRGVRIEQWRPAQEQGRIAAANLLGIAKSYATAPSMWSDQHEFHLQAAGFGFSDLEITRYGQVSSRGGMSFLGFRDGCLEAACGIAVGTGVARTIRAAQLLIESRARIDADLVDPSVELPRMARTLSR